MRTDSYSLWLSSCYCIKKAYSGLVYELVVGHIMMKKPYYLNIFSVICNWNILNDDDSVFKKENCLFFLIYGYKKAF